MTHPNEFSKWAGLITLVVMLFLLHEAHAIDPWEKSNRQKQQHGQLEVTLWNPRIVALSDIGEARWGYHQFPTISRLPDGQLLATWNAGPDRDDSYGRPGPACVSSDAGFTWVEHKPEESLLSVSHSPVSEVGDGEFLCIPMSTALDIRRNKIQLPPVAGTMNVYGELASYRLAECGPVAQKFMTDIPATRWKPDSKRWVRETVSWETGQALARIRKSEFVMTRPYIDNRILRVGDRLLYPAYHLNYLLPDGTVPKNYSCWCMASDDNGRSWQRHGLIAYDRTGEMIMAEPCLLQTGSTGLACIIRCSDQRQQPMLITYSDDGGKTWEQPQHLFDYGVMPQAVLLGNEVAVVSFGRPGIQLLFSPDGSAREWTKPLSVIAGDRNRIEAHSCGYTSLLPLDDKSFLLAYSDFEHDVGDGRTAKAILVRKISVTRKP
ncbi:MAG: exo-alpha-sialidase [Planctomycetaceae bacterium]|nr:exo-alpha-sialidase [Planctomycetaceae bacterium]